MEDTKMSNKTCENCGKEFDVIMASCGTSYTHMILKCPHCQHVHEERIYGSADMLKMINEEKDTQSNTQLHPLTESQISTLFNIHQQDLNFPRLVADVRVIEKAHGIGEEK
jgi:uncharacterized Zn finger protein